MDRKDLMKKYEEVLEEMSVHESGDFDELLDKLITEARIRAGELERSDSYFVPPEFDTAGFLSDYKKVIHA